MQLAFFKVQAILKKCTVKEATKQKKLAEWKSKNDKIHEARERGWNDEPKKTYMQPQPEPTDFSMLLDELRSALKGKAGLVGDTLSHKNIDEVLCEEVGLKLTAEKNKKGQTVMRPPKSWNTQLLLMEDARSVRF